MELKDGGPVFFGPNPEPGNEEEFIEDIEAAEDACPGTAENPEAAPGFLCIYVGPNKLGSMAAEPSTTAPFTSSHGNAASELGVFLPFESGAVANDSFRSGSWAVTASTPTP